MILGGDVVTAIGAGFTITVYDWNRRRWIGMGHHSRMDTLPGQKLYLVDQASHGKGRVEFQHIKPVPIGVIDGQNKYGTFGTFLPVGMTRLLGREHLEPGCAHKGMATVRILGGEEYPILITDIDSKVEGIRRFSYALIRTKAVPGMSGSPVVQDGHLVGALFSGDKATHISDMLVGIKK